MSTIDEQPVKDLSIGEPKQSESSCFPSLEQVERILGYKFNDKNLLQQAFTDSSYGSTSSDNNLSYERLEFVGDSVLNLAIVNELYSTYPNLAPGGLTELRAANVDTEKLARVSMKLGLHKYLRHKKRLLQEQIRTFESAILEYPLHSKGLVEAPKALADLTEAVIGAVYIDCNNNLDNVWQVFKRLLEPIITLETLTRHPVTELYEFCQKNNFKVKFVDNWEETTECVVYIDDQLMGTGTYGLKKEIAQNRAAKHAFNNLLKFMDTDQKRKNDGQALGAQFGLDLQDLGLSGNLQYVQLDF
ncbi:hypothetical protein ACFE04_017310 [Oxalis oulophora]